MDGAFRSTTPITPEAETRERWAADAADKMAARYKDVKLPDDVRPTHLWEVEFQSAMSDPVAYEQETKH